jgi:hypothetical protein
MKLSRAGFYGLATCGLAVAYAWLSISLGDSSHQITVCPIKLITKMPCPSCGATRAIAAIFEGHFVRALNTNPIGYVILSVICFAQILMIIDLIRRSQVLYNFYRSIDLWLSQRMGLTIGIFALLLVNWIWNIYKGI